MRDSQNKTPAGRASAFEELCSVIDVLRGEKGCPWDKKQTRTNIGKYIIEEAHEVAFAVEKADEDALVEELGDLLFLIIFMSKIAEQEGTFDVIDVIRTVKDKMVRRHPHVFGDAEAKTVDKVLQNWQKLKRKEKGEGARSLLDGIPPSMPPLMKAHLIGQRASIAGFDWPDAASVMDKIREELEELNESVTKDDRDKMCEELGDLLFSLVNFGRLAGLRADDALNKALKKFEQRFRLVEEELAKKGKSPQNSTLQEMDNIWEKTKSREQK